MAIALARVAEPSANPDRQPAIDTAPATSNTSESFDGDVMAADDTPAIAVRSVVTQRTAAVLHRGRPETGRRARASVTSAGAGRGVGAARVLEIARIVGIRARARDVLTMRACAHLSSSSPSPSSDAAKAARRCLPPIPT
ncbi:MAG: hypothetical protein M3Y87_34615 [Myxococcota bacterium]|nr:hypothetical protein [Myxococcota bacterium]